MEYILIFGLAMMNLSPTVGIEAAIPYNDYATQTISIVYENAKYPQANISTGIEYNLNDWYFQPEIGLYRKFTDDCIDHSNFIYSLNVGKKTEHLKIECGVYNECTTIHLRPSKETIGLSFSVCYKLPHKQRKSRR